MLEGRGEGEEALIVSIPDAEQNVVVEKRILDSDAQKLKRSAAALLEGAIVYTSC